MTKSGKRERQQEDGERTYRNEQVALDAFGDLLIESYAAGYAQAVDDATDEHPLSDTDPEATEYVMSNAFHHWDGRATEFEFWVRDQFRGDEDE